MKKWSSLVLVVALVASASIFAAEPSANDHAAAATATQQPAQAQTPAHQAVAPDSSAKLFQYVSACLVSRPNDGELQLDRLLGK